MVLPWLAATPIAASVLVDLPRLGRVGGWTGVGILAVGQVSIGILALLAAGAYLWRRTVVVWPIHALLGWMAIGMLWWPPSPDALPNALAYVIVACAAQVAAMSASLDAERTARALGVAMWMTDAFGLLLAAYSFDRYGFSIHSWPVHPRALALVALIPICWHLARWASGHVWDLLPVAAWVAAIIVSLSRMAAGAALAVALLTLVVHASARHRIRWTHLTLLLALLGGMLLAVGTVGPFRERLSKPQDRLPIWRDVVSSAMEAPILGKGPGSSQVEEVLRYWWTSPPLHLPRSRRHYDYAEYWAVHPHNDYLRVWHDLGLPGAALFVVALGLSLYALCGACRPGRHREAGAGTAQLGLAGLLTLVALMIAMTTDNPLVYPFVIGPAATLIGAGLGAATRTTAGHARYP